MCQLITDSLTAAGHDVRGALSGDDAIDLGHLFEPDVLITDWNLNSDYDGFEVATACEFVNKEIKTIVISGCPEGLAQHDSNANVFRTIAKPFAMDSLTYCVDEAMAAGTPAMSGSR
jgi:DNA-binding NtrC family response regulator